MQAIDSQKRKKGKWPAASLRLPINNTSTPCRFATRTNKNVGWQTQWDGFRQLGLHCLSLLHLAARHKTYRSPTATHAIPTATHAVMMLTYALPRGKVSCIVLNSPLQQGLLYPQWHQLISHAPRPKKWLPIFHSMSTS